MTILSTCRDHRKTLLVLTFDLIYPFIWIPLYTFVNVAPETGNWTDWTWRIFFGWMAATMFACTSRTLFRTVKGTNVQAVYDSMIEWLASSLLFCIMQWIANGVLDYWGAFWITLILRFFLVIFVALFILDVRRLSKDAALQTLQPSMSYQLSGSGSSGLGGSFKCKVA